MQQRLKSNSRKNFLLWASTLVAAFFTFKLFSSVKANIQEPGNTNMKMLTQDGKLVEVNKNLLSSSGKRISNEGLQTWIKK